jgi:putative phage-type endonuclease
VGETEALVLVETSNLSREDWLAWRRKGIGASDAPAVAGVSPWKTPLAVWMEKVGQQLADEPDNERLYWGRRLEPIVGEECSLRTGWPIRKKQAILQSKTHPFMLCNLDYLITDDHGDAVLECKTASTYAAEYWANNTCPEQYVIQAQHQMHVTGLNRVYIPVLIGGDDFQIRIIDRDQQMIDYLIQIETDFWRLVQSKTPPPAEASDTVLLSRTYPDAEEGKVVDLALEDAETIAAFLQARTDEGAAKKRKDHAANVLKAKLGAAEVGLLEGIPRVWWRASKSGERRFQCK